VRYKQDSSGEYLIGPCAYHDGSMPVQVPEFSPPQISEGAFKHIWKVAGLISVETFAFLSLHNLQANLQIYHLQAET
jgi:hypothetical protein